MTARVFFLTWVLALSSCAVGRVYQGREIVAEDVKSIVIGKTTRTEILEKFGPPVEFRRLEVLADFLPAQTIASDTEPEAVYPDVIAYKQNEARVKLLILILFNWVQITVRADYLVVFFDDKGVVKDYAFDPGRSRF
ncbi:MAG: hypothetical protein HYR85_20415 [Planctomycetes bacterium]|nr:hypothetical protein [Planctomycetota bacterium]MBI3845659.1 hypothetical protein [Planctomycetota bacterium]